MPRRKESANQRVRNAALTALNPARGNKQKQKQNADFKKHGAGLLRRELCRKETVVPEKIKGESAQQKCEEKKNPCLNSCSQHKHSGKREG